MPTFVSFSESNSKFSYYTNDENDVGVYNITLKVTLLNGVQLFPWFTLTVLSKCASATINAPASLTTQTYTVNAATLYA